MLRVATRIYNHLFNPSSLIKFTLTSENIAIDDASNKLLSYGILNTERNMKATILAYENLLNKFGDKRPLFVFKNATKCEHTSSHAASGEYFFDVDEYNFKNSASNGEIKKFHHILDILNKKQTTLDEFYGKINLAKDERQKFLNELACNDARVLDEAITVYLCPTVHAYECFARMINGYFVEDLQPNQIYALIKFLHKFGYDFIGISDALLLFYSRKKLASHRINSLCGELAKIYGVSGEQMLRMFEFALNAKNHLLLPYTNTFTQNNA